MSFSRSPGPRTKAPNSPKSNHSNLIPTETLINLASDLELAQKYQAQPYDILIFLIKCKHFFVETRIVKHNKLTWGNTMRLTQSIMAIGFLLLQSCGSASVQSNRQTSQVATEEQPVENTDDALDLRATARRFHVAFSTGLCLTVPGGAQAEGAAVVQSACFKNDAYQLFVAEFLGNQLGRRDVHRIKLQGSNKCLTVASTRRGELLVQKECNGLSSQMFRIVDKRGDSYAIKPVESNNRMCLEVPRTSRADGAQIIQAPCDGSIKQRFVTPLP